MVAMEGSAQEKRAKLVELLRSFGRVLVAFSGGVDSSFLAAVAYEALGDRARAVTGLSASVPEVERAEAVRVARAIGIPHEFVDTHEFENPAYLANDAYRCFHCKNELYSVLGALALARDGAVVVDGTNADDVGDWRPGRRAAELHGVRSPLLEVGLTKAEIRALSREMGLPTWDKPAMACLASRIPRGTPVSVELLSQVEAAELGLRALGLRQLRVRHHGEVARIETDEDGISRLLDPEVRRRAVAAVKRAGFRFVSLDLEGYRPSG